ncbi:Hypp4767 [Branchiostoma lanceolatum]|uniref:Hypp4767 protein n=1 Tax=Branchiostoma lanceolatum TaxID=7740 RepID=A0A8K0AC08_BRALA|nr:Hypp4767 [Branchiostoma lanceolatum]
MTLQLQKLIEACAMTLSLQLGVGFDLEESGKCLLLHPFERQRRAILKVFQKHQDTLAHTSTSNTRKDSGRKKRRGPVKNNTTVTTVDIVETNMMDTRAAQKTRHRRTRGRSKSADHSQRKVDRQEKAEFKKKTRALNDATERAKMERSALKDVNQGNNSALITRSRLTQKIGIFNKGKRSEAIHRDGIHISKETHAKAEEDMRKILDLSDAELSKPVRLQDLDYSPSVQNLHQNIAQSPGPSLDPHYTPVINQVKTSTPASMETLQVPLEPAQPPSVPASPVFFPSWHTYADLHPEAPHPQLCVEPGYVEQGYRSMDIIDYLDYQPPNGNTILNYQQGGGVVVRPQEGLLHHRFRSQYRGQGGSDPPSWPPPHHRLPWKPVEDTPSPRLYPMKLY